MGETKKKLKKEKEKKREALQNAQIDLRHFLLVL